MEAKQASMREFMQAIDQEELQEYRELYATMQRGMFGLSEELKRLQAENQLLKDQNHRVMEMCSIGYPTLMAEWMKSEHWKAMTAYQPTEEEKAKAKRLDELLALADKLLTIKPENRKHKI